jgi:hypothetical protein
MEHMMVLVLFMVVQMVMPVTMNLGPLMMMAAVHMPRALAIVMATQLDITVIVVGM